MTSSFSYSPPTRLRNSDGLLNSSKPSVPVNRTPTTTSQHIWPASEGPSRSSSALPKAAPISPRRPRLTILSTLLISSLPTGMPLNVFPSVLAMTTAAGQAKNVTSDAGVRNRVEAMNATAKASNTASPIWAPPTLGFGPIMYTSNTARNPRRRRSIRGRQCGNSSWTEPTTRMRPDARALARVSRNQSSIPAGLTVLE